MGAEGLVEAWRGLGCGRVVLCGVEDDSEAFRVCLHEFDRALAVVQAGFCGEPKSRLPLSKSLLKKGLDNPLEVGGNRTIRAKLEAGVPGVSLIVPQPQNLMAFYPAIQLLVRDAKELASGRSRVCVTDDALHPAILVLVRVSIHPNLLPFRYSPLLLA